MKKAIRISDLSIEPTLSRTYDMKRSSQSYRMKIAWLELREFFTPQHTAQA